MSHATLHYFSGKDLRDILTMPDCIEGLKLAFSALSSGRATMPLRTGIELEADNGTSLFMPVYLPELGKVGIKTVNMNRDNLSKNLPLIHAMVMVFDSRTGQPLAVMDGEVLTAMRTGAASGLATDYLARKAARVVAIFGAGKQSETQLEAVCQVRPIEKALIFDLDQEKAERFAEDMASRLNIGLEVAKKKEQLAEAEIVCTATSSTIPVLDDALLQPGTHINGVGSYKPTMAEISPQTMARAKIVVDQYAACLAEAGDLLQPISQGLFSKSHIHAELGEIILGNAPARENEQEITVFKSVGLAVQDLVTADLVLKRAASAGAGRLLEL